MDRFLKILLFEDDEVDKTLFRKALIEAGVNARLKMIDKYYPSELKDLDEYDCMFIDYRFSGKNGVNICKNIRDRGYAGPVVIISPYTDIPFIEEMDKVGATDFIPYTLLNREGIFHTIRIIRKINLYEKERKSAEEKLIESRKSYRNLVENSQIQILTHDMKGRIKYINPVAAEQLGYTKEELQGRNLTSIIEPTLKDFYREYIEDIKSKKVSGGIMQVITKSGEDHYWFFKAFISGEDLENVTVFAHDISERILAERELIKAKQLTEESNKIKERFLANMSHEIRTPMNAILGFTKILLSSDLTDEQREYIQEIDKSGNNLMNIVSDILDFSKIEAENIYFDYKKFNLSSLFNSNIDIYRSQADEKRIKILYSIDKNIPDTLFGDVTRLNQIFLNLIGNSVKFTEKGWVEVSAKLSADYENEMLIDFSVQDTGIGIPESRLEHIFDSFTQASFDTTRKYGGTGLGLSIVKRLVEKQGGSIKVDSKENEGTTVSFSLKLRKTPPLTLQPAEEKKNEINILLIESDKTNRLIDKRILSEFGFNILEESAEEDSIDHIKKQSADLIFISEEDLRSEGEKLSSLLKKENLSLPVLLLATSDEMENSRHDFIDGTIRKPFDKVELKTKISMFINESPSERKKDFDFDNLLTAGNGRNKGELSDADKTLRSQIPNYLSGMEDALKKENWERLSAIAGKVKSLVMMTGIKELEFVLDTIEKNISAKSNLDMIPGLIDYFKTTSDEILSKSQNS